MHVVVVSWAVPEQLFNEKAAASPAYAISICMHILNRCNSADLCSEHDMLQENHLSLIPCGVVPSTGWFDIDF